MSPGQQNISMCHLSNGPHPSGAEAASLSLVYKESDSATFFTAQNSFMGLQPFLVGILITLQMEWKLGWESTGKISLI